MSFFCVFCDSLRLKINIMKYLHTAIIALALFAFIGGGCSKSSLLPATNQAPKFTSAEANNYVKSLSQTSNDYAAAIKAKDVKKIADLTPKFTAILSKQQTIAGSLGDDEAIKFRDWNNLLMRQIKDLAKAASGPASTPASK